ncbi:MAG: DHHA1 domain-containing protein, partial [Candidatus Gracilibacteria bacterium]
DKPTRKYSFIPFVGEIETRINPSEHDLIVIVDCGAHYMTNFHDAHPEILAFNNPQKKPFIVNIDHHASNDDFGHINIVDPKSASTTMMLYGIFKYLDVRITPDMATCLITGIYNDTGSFMHSNTSLEVYEVAGELLRSGAKVSQMIKSLFRTNTIPTLKLWGKAFENAKISDENYIYSVVTEKDSEKAGQSDQISGAIDYLNMVPGVNFALLLHEDRSTVKGSLRTRRNDVDLSEIAKKYGGGGHPKAAGFTFPTSLG